MKIWSKAVKEEIFYKDSVEDAYSLPTVNRTVTVRFFGIIVYNYYIESEMDCDKKFCGTTRKPTGY